MCTEASDWLSKLERIGYVKKRSENRLKFAYSTANSASSWTPESDGGIPVAQFLSFPLIGDESAPVNLGSALFAFANALDLADIAAHSASAQKTKTRQPVCIPVFGQSA